MNPILDRSLELPPDLPSLPPTNLWSDEPPVESPRHLKQLILLLLSLERLWSDRLDIFIGVNLTVYYSLKQLKSRDFRGPDLFVVMGAEPRERKSWTVWEEDGQYPNVVLEVLSDSTAEVDRSLKKDLYQTVWRTPEYFWFDPYTLEFCGFRLQSGAYVPLSANEHGWFWSEELQLFLGILDEQLRWFLADGTLVATPSEGEFQERQRAEAECQRAEAERQRAEQAETELEQLRQRLRALGEEA